MGTPSNDDPEPRKIYPSLSIRAVDGVPESASQRGPRDSVGRDAVRLAMEFPDGVLEVTSARPRDIERFYRTMKQFEKRRKERYPGLKVQRSGDLVYISCRDQVSAPAGGMTDDRRMEEAEAEPPRAYPRGWLTEYLTYRIVSEGAQVRSRPGPRESICLEIVQQLLQSPTNAMEVTDESPEELERFYKSMLQWKSRHKALYPGLEVKKQASHVYVSIEPPEQLAS